MPGGILTRSDRHLHQIDLFRTLTFAGVILVHVVIFASNPAGVGSNAVQMLLHVTREAFFVLTGFVLTYQYARRQVRPLAFWRRRFRLVGIPYVVWTIIYWAIFVLMRAQLPPAAGAFERLAFNLIEGTGWYHLYFLLVSLQVYLLFPLLLRALIASRGRHGLVLAASLILQLVMDRLIMRPPFHAGAVAALWAHAYATVLAYQFYTLLGAVAALNLEAVDAFVRRHETLIIGTALAILAATELDYLRQVRAGVPAITAGGVFEPYILPWFVAIICALYALGTVWSRRRREGSLSSRFMVYASDRSFGIYLTHPLVLLALKPMIVSLKTALVQPWRTGALYVLTVLGTLAVTDVLRRIPGSLALTGRERVRRPAREAALASSSRDG